MDNRDEQELMSGMMENQKDLVKVLYILRQVINVKG